MGSLPFRRVFPLSVGHNHANTELVRGLVKLNLAYEADVAFSVTKLRQVHFLQEVAVRRSEPAARCWRQSKGTALNSTGMSGPSDARRLTRPDYVFGFGGRL